MTFPHLATRQNALDRPHDHNIIVATVMARQADSRTARAMLTARLATARPTEPSDDAVEQRIHYFGSYAVDGEAPRGAFLCMPDATADTGNRTEFDVYQKDSANIKALGLPTVWPGKRADLAGHEASRTI